MEKSGKKYLLLALLFASITTFLVYRYLSTYQKTTADVAVQRVLVANQMIPEKTTVTKNMIKEMTFPKSYIHPEAITKPADVIGKVTTDKILEGEQLVSGRFSDGQNAALAYQIPEKFRAVTIAANEVVEVANLIKPGDYVDILVTLEKEEVEQTNQIVLYPKSTKIVLQNIRILAVGQDMWNNEGKVNELPSTVTLAMMPEEAEKLVLAEEMGKIRLALRRVEDHDIIETPGAIREDISTKKGNIERQKNSGSGQQ